MSNDVFVGLDRAVPTHAVCVIDFVGSVLDRFEVAQGREVLANLMHRLAHWGERLRIAIERPSGLIVEALVQAGHEVFPIHPNAVEATVLLQKSGFSGWPIWRAGCCEGGQKHCRSIRAGTDGYRTCGCRRGFGRPPIQGLPAAGGTSSSRTMLAAIV